MNYWLRVLIKSSLSFRDIINIITEFADEYDAFDAIKSSSNVEDDGNILIKKGGKGYGGFGTVEASPGRIYHWRLKFIENEDAELNVGICEFEGSERMDWWNTPKGWSYFARDGQLYHPGTILRKYGDKYGKDDIIDVWLDLKHKNELSFAKNDKKYGKADTVKEKQSYKLAVGMYGKYKKVELLSFDIQY